MNRKKTMITVAEVAERLQTTPLNTLMHLKRGLLRGREENGRWLIELDSVAELQARTGGGKATGVCASRCDKSHACNSGCA